MPGRAAHIGLETLGVAGPLGLGQHPINPLCDFDQELQAAEVPHIAGQLRAVHALLLSLQLEGLDLFVGDLGEGLLEQVLAGGLLMVAHPAAKVVHGAQVKFAVAQVLVADGVTHLHIEGEGVVQLGIAPAAARFERFQADQHVDRDVGPRGDVAVQSGKGVFVEALKHFPSKGAGPGLVEPLALMGGQ